MSTPRPSTGTLFAYGFASRLYFHLPILLVYIKTFGIGVIETAALLAAYGLAMTAGSMLSGPQASRRTAPQLMAFGEVLKAAGLVLLMVGSDVPVLLAGQTVAGIGFGFTAGRESAVLRSSVAPDEVDLVQGNLQSWLFGASLVGMFTGSVLYLQAEWLPFAGGIVASLIAAAIALRLPAPPLAPATKVAAALPSLTSGQVGWVSYYVVSRGLGWGLFIGFVPLVLLRMDLSIGLYGVILGTFTLAGFLMARFGSRVVATAGPTTITIATMVSLVIAVALMADTTSLPVVLVSVAALGLGMGLIRPVAIRGLALPSLPPTSRGTLLMRQERWYGLVNAGVILGGGVLLWQTDLATTFLATQRIA